MTRKRFIKLLMADGYSRNEATEVAELVQKDNGTYAKSYDVIHAMKCFPELAEAINNLTQKWAEAFVRIADAVADGIKAFAQSFNEAMGAIDTMDVFKCPKCQREFTEKDLDEPPSYYDDDENEQGQHLWQVPLTCPYCGEEFWEEFWE